jgi:hypothetical protein
MVKVEQDHAYNDPDLSATDFLRAVMHDRTVPLCLRKDAAAYLLRLPEPPPAVVTIKIAGGMPGQLPGEAKPAEPADADTADLLAQYPVLRLVQ